MSQAHLHEPAMLAEVVDLFGPVPAGLIVDATAGNGGHAFALLSKYPRLRLLCIDRDPEATQITATRLEQFGDRAMVRHSSFEVLVELAESVGAAPGTLSGVLFDLGVSSRQLDVPERGFSYWHESPLDMRMDPSGGVTASEIANSWTDEEMTRLFAENGERRFSRRIARAVVSARPVSTTTQLAQVVRDAIPAAARRRGHPARRVFQALRIAVNDELELLEEALPCAIDALAPGGRCVALAYHSGEDRIVKAAFAEAVSGGCQCPPGLPCTCGARPKGHLVFRGARRPTPAEIAGNRRAESARLRAFERVAA